MSTEPNTPFASVKPVKNVFIGLNVLCNATLASSNNDTIPNAPPPLPKVKKFFIKC